MDNKLNSSIKDQWLLVVGIVLVASILRSAITSVGPIVELIKIDLSISNTMAGFLTTIPLLLFGIASPYVPRIAERFGLPMTIFIGLMTILIGILIRTAGGINLFLVGTVLLGIGIAVGNVTIPSYVKLKFPLQVGLITGLYGAAMNGMAGVGGGVSVPLSKLTNMGYKLSLSVWAVLVVIAIIVWLPQLKKRKEPEGHYDKENTQKKYRIRDIIKSRLVWAIALLFAMQSMIFYSIVAWMPSLLMERGLTANEAGYYFMFSQFLQIPIAFFFPQFVEKTKNQTVSMYIILVCFLVGFSLLFIEDKWILLLGVLISGAGIGAAFSASMTFFSVKAETYRGSIALSGFSQSVGYTFAAIGPLVMGIIFDMSQSWNLNNSLFIIMGILLVIFGLIAAKSEYIEDTL